MPRTLLGIKTQSPEAFPKKVTFKLLGNEDFQRLTQKLLYHTRRNTNGKMITKKKRPKKLSLSENDVSLITSIGSPDDILPSKPRWKQELQSCPSRLLLHLQAFQKLLKALLPKRAGPRLPRQQKAFRFLQKAGCLPGPLCPSLLQLTDCSPRAWARETSDDLTLPPVAQSS